MHQCWPRRSLKIQQPAAILDAPRAGTKPQEGGRRCRVSGEAPNRLQRRSCCRNTPGGRPPSRLQQPRRRSCSLLDCLPGLSPSSYVSWTYLLPCLQQFSGGGGGKKISKRFLYGKCVRSSQPIQTVGHRENQTKVGGT